MKRFRATTAFAAPLATLFGFFCFGCISADHRAATTTDSWFHPGEAQSAASEQPVQLDRSRIHPVVDARESWAETILANVSFAEITARQAEDATGAPINPVPGRTLYLVRGVYLNRGTGRFDVTLLPNNDISVFHGCLGRSAVPMKRQALVLELDNLPRRVFVSCGMIE